MQKLCFMCNISGFRNSEKLEAHTHGHFKDDKPTHRAEDAEDTPIQCDACSSIVPFS
jgi:hypothetical protein